MISDRFIERIYRQSHFSEARLLQSRKPSRNIPLVFHSYTTPPIHQQTILLTSSRSTNSLCSLVLTSKFLSWITSPVIPLPFPSLLLPYTLWEAQALALFHLITNTYHPLHSPPYKISLPTTQILLPFLIRALALSLLPPSTSPTRCLLISRGKVPYGLIIWATLLISEGYTHSHIFPKLCLSASIT